jgi:hypothetical protein
MSNGTARPFFLCLVLFSFYSSAAYAAGASFEFAGVKNTGLEVTALEFNFVAAQFTSPGTGPVGDNAVRFSFSGNEQIFQLFITGGNIKQTRPNVHLTGFFGETRTEKGTIFMVNPWWFYKFDFFLGDQTGNVDPSFDLDEVSVSNGIIQHLEALHTTEADAGIELNWGNLAIIADPLATSAASPKEARAELKKPFDCEKHLPHTPPHEDCITEGRLIGVIRESTLGWDFESWRLEAKAEHIGEPASITLLMSALLSAAAMFQRRRITVPA